MALANNNTRRDQLILEHIDVARGVARKMARRTRHLLSSEDIEAAALLGLTEAAERYDTDRAEPFFAFAVKRVRGAILDELRRVDELSRKQRQRTRSVALVRADIEQRLGRAANSNEVADASGMQVEEVDQARAYARVCQPIPFEDELCSSNDDEHTALVQAIDRRRQARALHTAMSKLAPRDRKVLGMYYEQGMSLREIGERLSVSESRVCQIRVGVERTLRTAVLSGAGAPANDERSRS